MEIPDYAKSVYKGLDDKPSTDAAPTTRRAMLDKARDTLKGDTYQLGSSSYLTAAREMKKPTPFKQRTAEQVEAKNLVARDRMARNPAYARQNRATALSKAKSRIADLKASNKEAQSFFKTTGISPRQVRALSGERMPERRKTYEAPMAPERNVMVSRTPSKKYEGRTEVKYETTTPAIESQISNRMERELKKNKNRIR